MPLTEKGEKIKGAMTKEYGSEKGERVFYASKNAGKISGVDARDDQAPSSQVKQQQGAEVDPQRPLPEQLARAENELEMMEREHEAEQLGMHRKHQIADHKKKIRQMRDTIKQEARNALGAPATKGDAADPLEQLESKQDAEKQKAEFASMIADMVADCEKRLDALQAKLASAKAECDDGGPGSGPKPKVGSGLVPSTGTSAAQRPGGYNREAVNKAIASSGRHGRPIGGREAGNIHRLLQGRH